MVIQETAVKLRDLKESGHAPTLFSAFMHFDISFAVWVILGALMPFIAKDLHLSIPAKMTLVAIPALSAGFWRILLGMLVDRYGAKPVGTISMALTLLPLYAGWQLANSYYSLFYVAIFIGMAGASFAVALPMASRWYPPKMQGIVMGIAGAGNSGTVLATLFAPLLAKAYGWHAVLGLLMVPVTIALLLFALLSKEPPAKRQPATLKSLGKLLTISDTWRFCMLYFVTFGGFVGMSLFFNTFFVDQYHILPQNVGIYTAPFIIIGSLLRPVGGALADKAGGIRVLAWVYTLVIISAVLLTFTISSFALSAVLLFCMMFLLGAGNGAVFQLVPLRFPREIGIVTGIVGAAGGEGGFYLNMMMGHLYKLMHSYAAGFIAFAAIAVVALITLKFAARVWSSTLVVNAPEAQINSGTSPVQPVPMPTTAG